MEVITFFGGTANRTQCRYIKGSFYEIGKEAYMVDGQWHRVNNSKIGYDMISKEWRLMESMPINYKKVLLNIDPVTNMPYYGYRPIEKEEAFLFVTVSRTIPGSKNNETVSKHIEALINRGADSAEAAQQYLVYTSKNRKETLPRDEWFKANFLPKLQKTLEELEESEYMNYSQILCEEQLAVKLGHVEDPKTGIFYQKDRLTNTEKQRISKIMTYSLQYYGRAYTTVGHKDEEQTREYSEIYSRKISGKPADKVLQKFIPYTFGIEHETIRGFIPEPRLPWLGLIPLRDGSLETGDGPAGIEYTSVPMEGEYGIRLLRKQAEYLKKSCVVNNKCAWHIHFSGFPRTWSYVSKLYSTCKLLEDEMYSLFPRYKRHSREIIGSQKEYTAPLPAGLDRPRNMFNYLSGGMDETRAEFEGQKFEGEIKHINIRHHPNGDQKWNRAARYHWINFEPIIFSPAQTIEFRLHTPTVNFQKMVAWLLICSAILRYAEIMLVAPLTKKLSLETVIKEVIDTKWLQEWVLRYIETRKSWFVNGTDETGEKEIAYDKVFSISTVGEKISVE
jgi:hypothetical protein